MCIRDSAYAPGGSLTFGVINHATSKVLNYLGSEDTYVRIRIEANGLVEGINVKVRDVAVHVDVTLGAGDVLEIDSESKTVKLNGADMAPALYTGERLPYLILKYGDNVVSVTADDAGNTAYDAEAVSYTHLDVYKRQG